MEKCPICGEEKKDVTLRRTPTHYKDEEKNFIRCCEDCFKDRVISYWEDMWRLLSW